MDQYIAKCKLLDTIDVHFLKNISQSEDWDSIFYELFNLIVTTEEIESTEEFLVYNRERLFFVKNKGTPKIEIRETPKPISKKKGELLLIINQKASMQSKLGQKIIQYLNDNKLKYSVINTNELFIKYKEIVQVILIERN